MYTCIHFHSGDWVVFQKAHPVALSRPPPPEPMARPMIIPIARDSRATTAHIHTLAYPDTSSRERVC